MNPSEATNDRGRERQTADGDQVCVRRYSKHGEDSGATAGEQGVLRESDRCADYRSGHLEDDRKRTMGSNGRKETYEGRKEMKKTVVMILCLVMVIAMVVTGCRESEKISYNLSQEADNFNIYRLVTVINTRTDMVMFQIRGNISIDKEADGDLAIIGEDENGQYFKHFICLSRDVSYIVEQIGTASVEKHKFEINFNPEMIFPFEATVVD